MKNLSEIAARLEAISIEVEALADVALESDNSEDTLAQIEALDAEFNALSEKKERLQAVQARVDAIVASRATPEAPVVEASVEIEPTIEENTDMIPAKAKYNTSNVFASSEDAYTAGQFLAAVGGSKKAQQFMAAQSVGTDSEGGFTVPTPLASELINLVENYGVARNVCRRVVMGAPTWSVPKLNGHSSIYYPAEAASITESQLSFEQITMNAVKMAGLVKMSTEINEDSLISMTDTIVRDLAWGFAKEEDNNLFTGGTLYTGGIEGDAGVADHNVASLAALTLEDLTATVVASGQERGLSPQWYFNATVFNGVIRDLLNAAGGNNMGDIAGGAKPSLLGYPVNLVNAMPGAAAVSGDVVAVFGDLSTSHYFGDRRSLSFNVLNELFAVTDQVGIICTQRVDIASVNPEVLSKITLS